MRKSLLVVLLTILAIGATLTAQAARLQYKDVAGVTRTYKASYTMKGSFNIPGQGAMPMNMVMTFTVREKVLQVANDGSAQIMDELKDGSITMTMDGKDMKQAFPGMTMTFERTPQGKVSNMEMSGEGAEMLKGMQGMGGMGMNQNMISQLGGAIEFPNRELSVGDTWKMTMPPVEPMPGMKLDIAGLYKYVGTKVTDGKNLMQVDTAMTMKMPKTAMKAPDGSSLGMSMTMNMTAKATTLFDEAAGALFSGSFSGAMTMAMSMKNPETGEAMNMSGNMTMTGWMKQVKVEKDAAFTAPAN